MTASSFQRFEEVTKCVRNLFTNILRSLFHIFGFMPVNIFKMKHCFSWKKMEKNSTW